MGRPIYHDNEQFWQSAVTVRRERLYYYDRFVGNSGKKKTVFGHCTKAKGDVSAKAAKRIAKYLELLYDAAKLKRIYSKKSEKCYYYRLGFLTLTLPSLQQHTDNQIHDQCFQPFIKAISRKEACFLYIYKAETQKNGNLHYHITTNTFLHKDFINLKWNQYINRLGYVDRYGKPNPPSTEIRAVKSNKDLAIYLAKYISKNDDERRKVSIKTWDCSAMLKSVKPSCILDFDEEYEFAYSPKELIFESDVCKGFKFTDTNKKAMPHTYQIWRDAINKIRTKTHHENTIYYV
jgi:hypothetical protein